MMLMKEKRMNKTKRRNTLLLSRVTSLLKGKQKNTLFRVLRTARVQKPLSPIVWKLFWKQKNVSIFILTEGDTSGPFL
jgi:hypothetical protein